MDGHKGKSKGKYSEDGSQNYKKSKPEFKKRVITAYRDFSTASSQEMLYNYVNKILSFSNTCKLHITANQG